ncbi:MAG: SUMF1/EgtB/PvdO family nonheme iron enzyme [Sedimentisphaerales bacterium]|nr:SUMF1/EgtB/PvdO family nonheme iron enzyme [Sedimentisphaerales bacterium]
MVRRSRVLMQAAVLAASLIAATAARTLAWGGKPLEKYTDTIMTKTGEELSFDMVLIPGGSFLMGSPADQPGRADDEGPQHKVAVAPFYLCTTETTLELFLAYYEETGTAQKDFAGVQEARKNSEPVGASGVNAITGPTPVYGDLTMGYDKKHPAMGMSWHNAVTYCAWLSHKTGKKYRLPTEAEWEYAARAGTTSIFGFGDDPNELDEYAWYQGNVDFGPREVGAKKPNAWGLYDMLGNVREWVHDFYGPAAYEEAAKANPASNPVGPATGKVHVARGGFYDSPDAEVRCAARAYEEHWWRMNDPQLPKSKWWLPQMDFIGFRVACEIDPSARK